MFCAALMILPRPADASQAQKLELVVLRGENATHLINYHRQEPLEVTVRIGGQPAKGVSVTFELPPSGPGGSFASAGSKTLRAITDKKGRASAKGFLPNQEIGSYLVRVTAEHQGQTVTMQVPQQNAASQTAAADNRKFGKDLLVISAIVVGVLVAVVVIANNSWN